MHTESEMKGEEEIEEEEGKGKEEEEKALKKSIYPFSVRKKCLDWMTSGVPCWLAILSLTYVSNSWEAGRGSLDLPPSAPALPELGVVCKE